MVHAHAHEDSPRSADSWAALLRARSRSEHVVVGLMSGTSADGIDAVVVRLRDSGCGVRHEVLAFESTGYPRALADRVLAAARADASEICDLDGEIGRAFGQAAQRVIQCSGLDPAAIDFVGSHGQTVVHRPPRAGAIGSTLQIGDPASIAIATGRPVISDFRSRDMALGGQGAPLVPLVDHLLFANPSENRVLLNIGGIANVSAVNGNIDDVIAFDTGPGNALSDALIRLATRGEERFDRCGERASRGSVDEQRLAELLTDPFLSEKPPKSADRDAYGEPMAKRLLAAAPERLDDLLATAAAFTVHAIQIAIERLPAPFSRIDRVIASGGGVHNRAILDRLRRSVGCPVETSADHGLDPDAKEAVAFAVLARETVLGRPGNLPGVTGARERAVLGSITL